MEEFISNNSSPTWIEKLCEHQNIQQQFDPNPTPFAIIQENLYWQNFQNMFTSLGVAIYIGHFIIMFKFSWENLGSV